MQQVAAPTGQEGTADESSGLVYALGKIGYDLVSRSRRDSIKQKMDEPANPEQPEDLLRYLETYPYEASLIQWTLELDGTPIYVIEPRGAFARDAFELLRQFLREELTEGVERVSIPGVIAGMVRMRSGLEVPIAVPVMRGMYSWTTQALVTAVSGAPPAGEASQRAKERDEHEAKRGAVLNFLERVYYELRNPGRAPQERALNFAATNAFEVEKIFEIAIREEMELDTIDVERSPVCPPGADCWDVKLAFFFPQRPAQTVRRVYRFTVDVADVVPATIGPVRSWFVR
jgi:cyanobactin maturation PatA/PatG family protease